MVGDWSEDTQIPRCRGNVLYLSLLLLLLSHFSRVLLCATPHRRQPTRLRRPWDSPGKNTGVGCHFLLQCMKMKSVSEVTQSCPTLRLLHPWDFPGKSTGVGCHKLILFVATRNFCLDVHLFKSSRKKTP